MPDALIASRRGDLSGTPSGRRRRIGRIRLNRELALFAGLYVIYTAARSLAATVRRRWLKALALLWAPLVALAVVATGNHYLFDVVTGALTAVVGYGLGRGLVAVRGAPWSTAVRALRSATAYAPAAPGLTAHARAAHTTAAHGATTVAERGVA